MIEFSARREPGNCHPAYRIGAASALGNDGDFSIALQHGVANVTQTLQAVLGPGGFQNIVFVDAFLPQALLVRLAMFQQNQRSVA
jgi:hypothetical protein